MHYVHKQMIDGSNLIQWIITALLIVSNSGFEIEI